MAIFFLCLKVVGLDYEFTDPRAGDQRTAVLQLSVTSETLVFQIIHADRVPQVLKNFCRMGTSDSAAPLSTMM
jgi:hypothetical protein